MIWQPMPTRLAHWAYNNLPDAAFGLAHDIMYLTEVS